MFALPTEERIATILNNHSSHARKKGLHKADQVIEAGFIQAETFEQCQYYR